ncbi:MAG: nucleotidyltransferase domain-containing protein [Nanoarchaeota archaeon]|nr:nucleotidyltransferase domain-containing protein [Nanoarchaeota archaeon]MBU4456873.1 nucleotidyltransferase domain-containing protein [Nanoarchaeota archaeon]MCG2719567.1 nucleotidyltransferase domain-containing protein [Nanoarchaeota archaeon]
MVNKVSINETVLRILSLYNNNYLEKLHLRKIAVSLKTTHRTISLHLERLRKLQVFKCELVGKSKQYFLNLCNPLVKKYIVAAENYASLDFLKKNALIRQIFLELDEKIIPENGIILFGSYAKGYANSESDIDILVIGEIKSQDFIEKIETIYGRKISVKSATLEEFSEALKNKGILASEVLKGHIVLRHPSLFVEAAWRYYEKFT